MDIIGFLTSEPVRTVLVFVAGGAFTAAIAEWRSRAEEGRTDRRAAADRIRALDMERIRQTQVAVIRYCQFLSALAVDRPHPGIDLSDLPRQELRLIGEEGGEVMLDTFPWLKEWDSFDRMHAVSRMRFRLLDLLDAQERRALAGVPLQAMSEAMAVKVGPRLPDMLAIVHDDDPSPTGR